MPRGKGQAGRGRRAATMRASFPELIVAVFQGAPSPQAAQTYSAQLTAIISIYLCAVAIFLIGLYIRATGRAEAPSEQGRLFKIWVAWSLILAIAMIAAGLVYYYLSIE